MGVRVSESFGCAELNKAIECVRAESVGPFSAVMHNEGSYKAVVSFEKVVAATQVFTDKDTLVTAEDTGLVGTGAQAAFTATLAHNDTSSVQPIVPGSVLLASKADATRVLIYDTNKDGILWTDQATPVAVGTINYFTGVFAVTYPAGHLPVGGGGDHIFATYHYQDSPLRPQGKKTFAITNVQQGETIVVKAAAADARGSLVHADGVAMWK